MIILKVSDFKQPGFYNLALDNTTTGDLQAVIDEWESYYIYQLLSNNTPAFTKGLAQLFIEDCQANAGVPITPRFVKIFNAFNEMVGSNMYSSKGMKAILMGIIVYHYITETSSWSGISGIAQGDASAAKGLGLNNYYRFAESRFNDTLEYVKAITWWLQSGNSNGGGLAEYPEYLKVFDHYETFRPKAQSIL